MRLILVVSAKHLVAQADVSRRPLGDPRVAARLVALVDEALDPRGVVLQQIGKRFHRQGPAGRRGQLEHGEEEGVRTIDASHRLPALGVHVLDVERHHDDAPPAGRIGDVRELRGLRRRVPHGLGGGDPHGAVPREGVLKAPRVPAIPAPCGLALLVIPSRQVEGLAGLVRPAGVDLVRPAVGLPRLATLAPRGLREGPVRPRGVRDGQRRDEHGGHGDGGHRPSIDSLCPPGHGSSSGAAARVRRRGSFVS